jgi:protein-S-isoprenylcysteine O-methyltransferase Ste14
MGNNTGDQQDWQPSWRDYVVSALGGLCFLGQVVLCFTSYNRFNLDRVLYLGWTVLAAALLMGMSARRTFEEHGGSEEGARWPGTSLADSGIYGVVRHPIYMSFTLVILALMLISQHWLSVVLGLPWMAYLYLSMLGEERINVQRFGDAYRAYMEQVPRLNFVLGAIRHWRRQRARAAKKGT